MVANLTEESNHYKHFHVTILLFLRMHALSGVTSTINMAAVAMMEAAILSLVKLPGRGWGARTTIQSM